MCCCLSMGALMVRSSKNQKILLQVTSAHRKQIFQGPLTQRDMRGTLSV